MNDSLVQSKIDEVKANLNRRSSTKKTQKINKLIASQVKKVNNPEVAFEYPVYSSPKV